MRKSIVVLGICLILTLSALSLLVWNNPVKFVAVKMLWSLTVLWVFLGGSLMYLLRNIFVKFYSKIKWPFWLKFTFFATLFSLIEEAIAVSVNNYFSGGQAILTASTDYWEVVSHHSVVILIPIFFIFSFFVKKFNFTPYKSFLYFGIIGVLAEFSIGGILSLFEFSLWIFVYGLIVYLPSHLD